MKGFVPLAALLAAVWFGAGPAGASHENNASSACCAPSDGFACDEVGTPMNRRGCAEDPTGMSGDSLAGGCLGGTLEPEEGGRWGCLCLADGLCLAGKAPSPALPVTPEECSRSAVEACCAAGVCHSVEP